MAITTDTFTGSADTQIFGAGVWTTFGAGGATAFKINASNQGKIVGADTPSNLALCGQDVGGADHFAEVAFLTNAIEANTGGFGILAVRVVDRNEYFGASWDSVGSLWRLRATGHGGAWDSVSGSFSSGDLMRLEAEGTVSRLYQNGSLILTSTIPTAYNGFTKVGLALKTTLDLNYDPMVDTYRSGLLSDLAGGASGLFPPFVVKEPSTQLRM